MTTLWSGVCPVCESDCGAHSIVPFVMICDDCDVYHNGNEEWPTDELDEYMKDCVS